MAAIGYGKYSARQILARLAPASSQNSAHPEEDTSGISSVVRRVFGGDTSAILVKGHDDLLVYRARCCNPIKGEDVVGYITRGKGVAVHSKNCPNVLNLMYEPERRIDVDWARKEAAAGSYPVKLTLFTDDRAGHDEADHRHHQRREHQHPEYERRAPATVRRTSMSPSTSRT